MPQKIPSSAPWLGWKVTDANEHELWVTARTRGEAKLELHERYGTPWTEIRVVRDRDLDNEGRYYVLDWGAFCTVECWGVPVRL